MSLMRCVGGSMHGKHVLDMTVFRCVVPKDIEPKKHWQTASDMTDYVNFEVYHRFMLPDGKGPFAVLRTMRARDATELMIVEGWLK
jgi:hypothetical protein